MQQITVRIRGFVMNTSGNTVDTDRNFNVILMRVKFPRFGNELGNWITQQGWQTVYNESLVNDKLTVFTNILSAAVDTYLPFCKIKVCSSDRPWITTKIKSLIRNRQKALHVNGKDSEIYKAYRNAVQTNCSIAKKTFYTCKVAALRSSNIKRWWSEINRLSGKWGVPLPGIYKCWTIR